MSRSCLNALNVAILPVIPKDPDSACIAKSIIDLHEGSLDIEIDGDLFKGTIVLTSLM